MTAFKRFLTVTAIMIGAAACLATPTEAQAQTRIAIGIGGPIVRPVPAPIIRPVPIVRPMPVVTPVPIGYPSYRPSFYPPIAPVHGHHHFDVLYRDCSHDPWRVYGRFDCREDAERAAFRLERFGNQTFIKTIHHH